MDVEKRVKKAIKGNKKEFEFLINEEKEKLYRIAFLHVKNQTDALEIVQDTVYKAFVSIHKLQEPAQFTAWIKKILIHCALDFLKKKQKVIFISNDLLEWIPDKAIEIDTQLDLMEAIDQLNGKYKSVIILKYYEDLPNKEIATIMDIPEGTVKSTLHRALQQLRVVLEGKCANG
ncbi:sigma-70 family RNA polymerase sigma factor [Alkalihalobacterium bogoriense]|uniref:sigma-70 family RNA polymerase sigma factor n=1 Tax=Alkalihalobacterium bogoriense TaxID=246272 RepID=UPI00047E9048|nr:sigma-70 family RNA polymerase sigma factor [Alkalihalobacterium bogoriense]